MKYVQCRSFTFSSTKNMKLSRYHMLCKFSAKLSVDSAYWWLTIPLQISSMEFCIIGWEADEVIRTPHIPMIKKAKRMFGAGCPFVAPIFRWSFWAYIHVHSSAQHVYWQKASDHPRAQRVVSPKALGKKLENWTQVEEQMVIGYDRSHQALTEGFQKDQWQRRSWDVKESKRFVVHQEPKVQEHGCKRICEGGFPESEATRADLETYI